MQITHLANLVGPTGIETRGRFYGKNSTTRKTDEEFVEKMRISRNTFNIILRDLWDKLILQPTNFKPEPTSPDRQLALTMYRLAHGVTYTVLEDVFGVSKESSCTFFNKVIRLIVAYFYDDYVKLPETDEEWESEIGGFIENYGFPCVGAWDGFYVHVNSQLKSNFSFKKKYTVNNLALTSYRHFLHVWSSQTILILTTCI